LHVDLVPEVSIRKDGISLPQLEEPHLIEGEKLVMSIHEIHQEFRTHSISNGADEI
jgi:hypothetical protein